MTRAIVTWIVLMAALAGCATVPPEPAQGGVAASELSHWIMTGKLGVRQPEERLALSLRWQQKRAHYRINLSGPLGLGAAVIAGNPDAVSVTTAEGTVRAASPENLLARELGWSVPVAAARWWVRGLPAPGRKNILARNAAGRIERMTQQGWRIAFERWTVEQRYALPTVIRMERGPLELRLVVSEWRAGEAALAAAPGEGS